MARRGLIEREKVLAALRLVTDDVRAGGGGRLVLVTGEAGAGKTAVVRELAETLPPDQPVLWGSCDSLRTARAFGPVVELAGGRSGSAARAIAEGAPREEIFDLVLELLGAGTSTSASTATVAVVEDAHWADEATLDLLSFLGRRLARTRAALIVTYRADEVTPSHPLFVVLGDLATTQPVRLPVEPLSVDGVAALAAGRDVDPVRLHARTGGNAFFVTECLSAGDIDVDDVGDDDGDDEVPESVRAAVLTRARGLSPDARGALDAVAVVPGRAELWLVDGLGAGGAALDECVDRGVLVADGPGIAFRHELARIAVLEAVPPGRQRELHRRALAVLSTPPDGVVDHARLVHHAEAAGDVDAVLHHGPTAARLAAQAGARREAAAHLELTLRYEGRLAPAAARDLWGQLAQHRSDLGRYPDAVDAYDRAVELAAAAGDDERHGELLARLAAPLTILGHEERSRQVAKEATTLLERLPPGRSLALAYVQRCGSHMLARELAAAEPWGRRAMALAEELQADDVLARACIQSGVALWMAGDDDGLARIRRGIDLGRAGQSTSQVVFGLVQIGSGGGEVRRYAEAIPALRECIELADRFELAGSALYAAAWLARCDFEQGRWPAASDALATVLRSRRCSGITRMTALTVTGSLRARRGDPEVWPPLDEALGLARETGHLQRLWPVAAARAEAAWLGGHVDTEVALLDEIHALASRLDYGWARGELGFWLWRAGALAHPEGAAPFVLHAAGRPREAAARWEALGCPYEQAAALADVVVVDGDGVDGREREPNLRAALAIFDALGAAPARARVSDGLRDAGLVVPRGPNAATKGNPGGLTDREIDVLRLIAAGSSNPEIASRLRISVKTVGHHVSHALTKLGARSRAEAVVAAAEVGLQLDRSGA